MRLMGLVVLVGVTAGAVAGARKVLFDAKNAEGATESTSLLLPDLLARVNDVAEVAVETTDETATLTRKDGEWVLAERGDFPATFDKVKGAIMALAHLEIEEPKTAKPENHAKLGVEDPSAPESESKRVTLRDASGTELAAVIVGDTKYRSGSQAGYVRRNGEDQVYLCAGRIDVQANPTHWVEKEIIRLDRERVAEIEIRHHDGEEVLIGRSAEDENTFEVQNLPEGREERNVGVANGVGTALSYLGLDDVRPAAEVDFTAEPVATSVFRCDDGLVVTADIAKFEEKSWIRLSTAFEPVEEAVGPAPEAEPSDTEAVEGETAEGEGDVEGEEEAEDAPDPDAVRKEAEELAARFAGWAYAIPDYKVNAIARRMADLLKELEDETRDGGLPEDLPLSMEGLMDQIQNAGDGVSVIDPADFVKEDEPRAEADEEQAEVPPADPEPAPGEEPSSEEAPPDEGAPTTEDGPATEAPPAEPTEDPGEPEDPEDEGDPDGR